MNISVHISYKEATFSATAVRKGILNEPNENQLKKMVMLAEKIFEPLRLHLGGNPIYISSFFRSAELNSLIGGSKNSQHCMGEAMDIDNSNNKEIFEYIKDNLIFDQLIDEYPDLEWNPSWVHVSYRENNNRMQVLRCINGNYHLL